MLQMVHDPEDNRDHTHPVWVVIHWSAVKTNILCSKWAFGPSGSLISTFYTCISSSHCGQSHHMLRSVITAECLQSSHINTCVKQHGVPSCPSFFFFFWQFTKLGFVADAASLMVPSKLSAHLRQRKRNAYVIILLILLERICCCKGKRMRWRKKEKYEKL